MFSFTEFLKRFRKLRIMNFITKNRYWKADYFCMCSVNKLKLCDHCPTLWKFHWNFSCASQDNLSF